MALIYGIDIQIKKDELKMHSINVCKYCCKIGEALKLTDLNFKELSKSAMLHDIGKFKIPHDILYKKEPLSLEEFEIIKKHSSIGSELLRKCSYNDNIVKAVLHHHERFDGGGYPSGLKEESIPLYSRIIAVVDSFDAMVSNRVYRKRELSQMEALEEIVENSGTQFDPKVVYAFLNSVINITVD